MRSGKIPTTSARTSMYCSFALYCSPSGVTATNTNHIIKSINDAVNHSIIILNIDNRLPSENKIVTIMVISSKLFKRLKLPCMYVPIPSSSHIGIIKYFFFPLDDFKPII